MAFLYAKSQPQLYKSSALILVSTGDNGTDEPILLYVNTSGVNDLDAASDGIIITPTLVRDMVHVRSGSLLKMVAVYSPNGACLPANKDINDNVTSLNLGDLPTGVYLVEAITATGNRAIQRIVKQ